MKYLRHIFKEIGYGISDFLRRICGSLSEDARIVVIISMLFLFTAGNLYFTISTIYNWGREKGRKEMPEIQHIDGVEIKSPSTRTDTMNLIDSPIDIELLETDSINNIYFINNEKRTRKHRPC